MFVNKPLSFFVHIIEITIFSSFLIVLFVSFYNSNFSTKSINHLYDHKDGLAGAVRHVIDSHWR